MNRETKFKFFDTKSKKVISGIHLFINGSGIIWENRRNGIEGDDNLVSTKQFIPMQYANFKDRKGQEVYRGYICEFFEKEEDLGFFHGLAFWDDIGWKVIRCNNEGGIDRLDSSAFWNDEFEVVGNIYENSNLLSKPEVA